MRLNPRLYDAAYLYGRCAFAQGKMEEASALFRKASELDPADYQCMNMLHLALRALGRHDEGLAIAKVALERTERHLEVHPDDARAYYLGSHALFQLGQPERAVEW